MGTADHRQQVHVTDAGNAIAESVNVVVLLLEACGAIGVTPAITSPQEQGNQLFAGSILLGGGADGLHC